MRSSSAVLTPGFTCSPISSSSSAASRPALRMPANASGPWILTTRVSGAFQSGSVWDCVSFMRNIYAESAHFASPAAAGPASQGALAGSIVAVRKFGPGKHRLARAVTLGQIRGVQGHLQRRGQIQGAPGQAVLGKGPREAGQGRIHDPGRLDRVRTRPPVAHAVAEYFIGVFHRPATMAGIAGV